ncbi:protein TRC8 homolog [Mizuhopecten yessoensis]|uniref:Protein TRC8-like n=1 Tax=Mizuhopecten yessoensis TaxID=6573 RepID=A0A210Q9V3_MIZYE|nr:protein TRC8 homolog [Mizuhopecten yessoensis]OWF45514.1 Protein TRC8-like [Mizuhopecten yessoensis]
MPWLTEIFRMWEVILRVPPLFVIDSLLNNSLFTYYQVYFQFLHFETPMTWIQYIEWLFLLSLCTSVALVIFLLGTRQLLTMYSYILSLVAVFVSLNMNLTFTRPATKSLWMVEFSNPKNQTTDYLVPPEIVRHGLQTCINYLLGQLAAAFIFCKSWQYRREVRTENKKHVYSVFLSFIFPIIMAQIMQMMDLSSETLLFFIQVAGLVLPLEILSTNVINTASSFYFTFKRSYNLVKLTIGAIGLQGFLENHWVRLQVPRVLRIFFTSRFIFQVGYLYWSSLNQVNVSYFSTDILNNIGYQVVVRSCDDVVALLGLTSIVSFCAHYIGVFMAFCIGSSEDDDKNMGTVSAILFFILALQTGLTGLEPDKRLVRLCKNLYLLGTAITHFVHSMVHPLLMSLSASRNMHIQRHVRALAMCAFLITFPSCLLVYLWSMHKVNTWLMAVTAFSLEVIIKVIVSLMVYFLFMLDAYRDKFWESLDDYVYYIQSTGNTIEFLFGIFLFCNGGWILLFESGGTIRAVMMCIHAYFNIWVQAKEGWKVFMKRKTAVDKINSLPLASQEQLDTLNDVCAICYQELQNARITSCNHYFHGVCLRKWLYVQDNCPMCYKVIYHTVGGDNSSVEGDDANQNNINNGLIAPVPVQRDHQD